MKHLKLFETFNEEVYDFCFRHRLGPYTINEDGSINIDNDVRINFNGFSELPIKFKKVTGSFHCFGNYNLTTLKGCPEYVGGDFWCYSNKLTSLEGCPKVVGDYFDCENNKIMTFEHLPFSIGGRFVCRENPIAEIWKLFEDYSKIEFLNYCDPLREPDDDSDEPIVILEKLNYFLEEIGKPNVTEVKGYKCI